MTIRTGQIATTEPILPCIASLFSILGFLEVTEQTFIGGFSAAFLDEELAIGELKNVFRELLRLHRHDGGSK